jgi:hypothetical protein
MQARDPFPPYFSWEMRRGGGGSREIKHKFTYLGRGEGGEWCVVKQEEQGEGGGQA